MRHRYRLLGLRAARLAHAPHDADLRFERPGEACVYPQLRLAGPGARCHGPSADPVARDDLDGSRQQPHLLRLRYQWRRHAADRRSRQVDQRSQGPDAGEPALSPGLPARSLQHGGGAHHLSGARREDGGVQPRQAGLGAGFRGDHRRADRQRVRRAAPAGLVCRRHRRDPPAGGLEFLRAGGERRLLQSRRPLRDALLEREHGPDLLQEDHVLLAFQRRRSRSRALRSRRRRRC